MEVAEREAGRGNASLGRCYEQEHALQEYHNYLNFEQQRMILTVMSHTKNEIHIAQVNYTSS